MWAVTTWGDARWATVATIVQAIGTLTAIFVGGGFAFYRLQMLRTFHPYLTIEHEVSHRPVGDSYVHIALTVRLRNTSRVVIELRQGSIVLQLVSPITDEELERLYGANTVREPGDIAWPTLEEFDRHWEAGDLVIEPGESFPEHYEFVVAKDIQSVLVYSFYEHPTSGRPKGREIGWHALTVYDILEEV